MKTLVLSSQASAASQPQSAVIERELQALLEQATKALGEAEILSVSHNIHHIPNKLYFSLVVVYR